MVDDVNTQTEKALAPIQLADASGPQPLADERNNQFLQELFDKKYLSINIENVSLNFFFKLMLELLK